MTIYVLNSEVYEKGPKIYGDEIRLVEVNFKCSREIVENFVNQAAQDNGTESDWKVIGIVE